jgi:hypothetical protein
MDTTARSGPGGIPAEGGGPVQYAATGVHGSMTELASISPVEPVDAELGA